MSLKLVIENLRHLSDDVWETELCAEELGVLSTPDFCEGEINVVAIKNPVVDGEGRVELDFDQARVLNLGEGERTLVIALRDRAEAPSAEPRAEGVITPIPSGTSFTERTEEGAEDESEGEAEGESEGEAAAEPAETPPQAEQEEASRPRPLSTGFWEVREIRERRDW